MPRWPQKVTWCLGPIAPRALMRMLMPCRGEIAAPFSDLVAVSPIPDIRLLIMLLEYVSHSPLLGSWFL